jgi:hypothetical protein
MSEYGSEYEMPTLVAYGTRPSRRVIGANFFNKAESQFRCIDYKEIVA